MKYQAFVDQVRTRALLDNREEANQAIRATLQTLGERLVADEIEALADRLPPEIGSYLGQHETGESEYAERAEEDLADNRMDLGEFYRRVAKREGVEDADAVYHARIVASVLHAALPAAEMARLRALLPEEFDHLFAFVGKGKQEIRSATARDDYW